MNKHLHIMGIEGSGAKAFGQIAKAQGYKVTGCDRSLGGHDRGHLGGVDVLVVSPAILSFDPGNPELTEAKRRGIEISTWQEFLGKHLMERQKVVGVCGSHGKSTITAMLSHVLQGAGLDPTFLVGAKIKGGVSSRVGEGDLFVVEADEFNDNFLNYPVFMSICVSLEFDHPEYFSDFNHYLNSFVGFVRRGRVLVCNKTDRGVGGLLSRLGSWGGEIVAFDRPYRGDLMIPGEHNLINAQAVYLAARSFGVAESQARSLLASFPGAERRLELKKTVSGTKIYNDYAHHPTQLRTVCKTLRQLYPREHITVVFQPHMFTRTKAFFDEFVDVLQKCPVDCLILDDIFPSREKDPGDIKACDLADAAGASHVFYLPHNSIIRYLREDPSGVVVFAGAGDVVDLVDEY